MEIGTLYDVIEFKYTEKMSASIQKSGSITHTERYQGIGNLLRCYHNEKVLFTLKLRNQDESLLQRDSFTSTMYDCLWFLDAKKTIRKYSISAGENIIAHIKRLCYDAGVKVKINDNRLILSKSAVFDEGTSYLDMINTLLDICNYQHIKTDVMGYFVVAPKKSASDGFDYLITANNTMILEQQTRISVDEDIPNVVAVVYEGEHWNVVGVAYNNDSDSDFSIVRRGYELTSVEKVSDVGTETSSQLEIQKALDRLAVEKMNNLKRNARMYRISVLMDRVYSVGDYAYVETKDGVYDLYVIESVTFDSHAGMRCDLSISTIDS